MVNFTLTPTRHLLFFPYHLTPVCISLRYFLRRSMNVKSSHSTVVVDGWIYYKSKGKQQQQIAVLRWCRRDGLIGMKDLWAENIFINLRKASEQVKKDLKNEIGSEWCLSFYSLGNFITSVREYRQQNIMSDVLLENFISCVTFFIWVINFW